jgi:hypothetical protein
LKYREIIKLPIKIDVAVVAIAKDEGAYIHEWIHHYLYFGFSRIIIGVNRTTDLTPVIINKISEKYPQVSFMDMDWIDQGCIGNKNSQFQAMSYACLTSRIKTDYKNITHFLYVDIDEFWFADDFTLPVKDYVASLPPFDVLSFNWLWQNGDDKNFETPFNNKKITINEHMKSMISVDAISRVVEFRCHASKMDNKQPPILHIGPNGEPVKYGAHDQAFGIIPSLSSRAFVLHRVCRSATEYVALLTRQRPGVEFPFKNNRFGFSKASSAVISLDKQLLESYWSALDKFINECDIMPMLSQSRQLVIEKAELLLDVSSDIVAGHLMAYLNILKGTLHQKKVLAKLEKFGASVIKDKFAKSYFDAGMMFERDGDMSHALGFLRLANLSRPKGPIILEHYERLDELVKKKG